MNATGGQYGNGLLPLAGAILCCTSIAPEQRTQLAHLGAEMGATIKLDLTSDVTHLIVGSTDSAKYRYVAKCRNDVKVLLPAWLDAVRDVWLQGSDHVDVAALEAEYRLPTFYGLRICLTGFDNPEQRRSIQESVDENGGEYHGDLTKAVTHLIAASPSGKKYEHALNWRMKIVTLEWFQQSLERGMVLEEALFDPTLPVEQRGKDAWDRRQPTSPSSLGKRVRNINYDSSINPLRRKLRRSASTKIGSQSEALWAGITAMGMDIPHNVEDDWTENSATASDDTRGIISVPRPVNAANPVKDPPREVDPADVRQQVPQPLVGNAEEGIFRGRIVYPHGFDAKKTDILRAHLESQGARLCRLNELTDAPSADLKSGFLVLPHDAKSDLTLLPDRAGSLMNVVSNWWVERCLHSKRLLDPADSVLNRPIEKIGIKSFHGLILNSTGFAGIDLLHVSKVVALLGTGEAPPFDLGLTWTGATYDEQLSAQTSVMVCNSSKPNLQKLKFATDRGIPAVSARWLWDCISHGALQSYNDYQLNGFEISCPHKLETKLRSSDNKSSNHVGGVEKQPLQQNDQPPADTTFKPKPTHKSSTSDSRHPVEVVAEIADSLMTRAGTSIVPVDLKQGPGEGVGHASMTLQDINSNLPRRPSTDSADLKSASRHRSSSAESLIRSVPNQCGAGKTEKALSLDPKSRARNLLIQPESVTMSEQPPNETHEERDYSDILAKLRANRKAPPRPVEQADGKRRRRQLGRATSTRSNQSTGEVSSGDIALDDDEENTVQVNEYEPSQQLGWDSPGAAKAREQMIRRLGGTMKEKSVPVEGIGIVRDVGSESTGRASRRRA